MSLKFMVYGDSTPSLPTGIGTSGMSHMITAADGQTIFKLPRQYRPGTGELQVYLNGVRQIVDVDYEETDAETITFLEPTEDGDTVYFSIAEIIHTSLHQEFIAGFGQYSFTLSKPYLVGMKTLDVYENGVLLRVNDDYMEEDEYTISFHQAPKEGARITIREKR